MLGVLVPISAAVRKDTLAARGELDGTFAPCAAPASACGVRELIPDSDTAPAPLRRAGLSSTKYGQLEMTIADLEIL